MSGLKIQLLLPGFPKTEVLQLRSCYPNVKVNNKKLNHAQFLGALSEARVCLFPNRNDASPRVISEALCMNMPVLVNSEIVGGWKYVNRDTGRFFNDGNFDVALEDCLELATDPKCHRWFTENYALHAQVRLAEFINDHCGTNARQASLIRLDKPRCDRFTVRRALKWF